MGGYELDSDKDRINREKHQLALVVGVLVFSGIYIEAVDDRFDYGETRFRAIGPVAAMSNGYTRLPTRGEVPSGGSSA